jgi:hypothetical protein
MVIKGDKGVRLLLFSSEARINVRDQTRCIRLLQTIFSPLARVASVLLIYISLQLCKMTDARASHINAKQGTIKAQNKIKLASLFWYDCYAVFSVVLVCSSHVMISSKNQSKTCGKPPCMIV